jgi:hypothetical protein
MEGLHIAKRWRGTVADGRPDGAASTVRSRHGQVPPGPQDVAQTGRLADLGFDLAPRGVESAAAGPRDLEPN